MRPWIHGLGALVILAGVGQAQDWVAQWDGPDGLGDIVWCMDVDPDGAVVVAGPVEFAATGTDMAIVRYDATGNQVWEAWYASSGTSADTPFDVKFDDQGNVLVSGRGPGPGGTFDLILLKYDPAGTLLWSRAYDGAGTASDYTSSNGMVVDATGHVMQCGAVDVGGGDYDGVVLRYAPDGTLVWSRTISGTPGDWDASYGLFVDSSGNIYTSSEHSIPGDWDLAVTKFDASGTVLWESYADLPGVWEAPFDLDVDAGGNVFVAGITYGGAEEEDALLVRFDAAGNLSWMQTYDGPTNGSDYAFALAVDGQGGAVISGYSEESIDAYCLVARYNAAGKLLWADRYVASTSWWGGDSWCADVEVDAAGNVWASANAYVNPFRSFDATVLLYSRTGVLLDVYAYNGPASGQDSYFAMGLDAQGNGYAAGLTLNTSGDLDFLVTRMNTPFLRLGVTSNLVLPGDDLTFDLEPGLVGAPGLLAAVDVNGIPLFAILATAPFDANGEWSWGATVPPGLSGLVVTFGGYGVDQWGQTMATNQEIVTFQ